jgi:hypothetical protein
VLLYGKNGSFPSLFAVFKSNFFLCRPDVKISEDASSDKSGTDPEDSSDNFSQADITDYQNYEQVGEDDPVITQNKLTNAQTNIFQSVRSFFFVTDQNNKLLIIYVTFVHFT